MKKLLRRKNLQAVQTEEEKRTAGMGGMIRILLRTHIRKTQHFTLFHQTTTDSLSIDL